VKESLRHRLARYVIVIAIFGVVGAIYVQRQRPSAPAEAAIAVDAPAPDFTLASGDGTVRLSDLRGRIVIVNFWATWCGPCRLEMPELQRVHEAHAAAGDLVVLAVNYTAADSRSAAEAYIEEFGFTFPVAFDTDGAVAERYEVIGLPASFFIDREGVLRARTYGPLDTERLAQGITAAGGLPPRG